MTTKIINLKSKSKLTPEQEAQFYRTFASWAKRKKLEYLKKASASKAWRLKYTWRAWARDKQLAPVGEWSTWVIQAGRGFGKTRAGAEWVIEKAFENPGCHIALVGRTVADVRDVMVKGRSGILAVSPPWFKPVYYPSKRQLVWPNGATATTYSADSPDQLRGPQHSYAWADERCFIEGTLIRTSKGLCPIEKIQPGDLVHTREGLKRVKHAGLTNSSTTVYDLTTSDGRVLTGTGNHPIWVQDKGFKPLHSLSYGDTLMVWEQMKLNTVSFGVDADGGSMEVTTATEKVNCCTEQSTQQSMDLSPRVCTSTTKTATKQTTTFPTSKQLHLLNTLRAIHLKDGEHGGRKSANWLRGISGMSENHIWLYANSVESHSPLQGHVPVSVGKVARKHIDAKTQSRFLQPLALTVANRFWSTKQVCATVRLSALMQIECKISLQENVSSAKRIFKHKTHEPFVAHGNVVSSTRTARTAPSQGKENAPIAEKHLPLNIHHLNLYSAQDHAETSIGTKAKQHNNVYVTRIKPRAEKMAVFNMEVEDCHEYFANDVLVHNCAWQYDDAWDQLMFGLRIVPLNGGVPQCVVTTTPRNTKAMKELVNDPTTVVTRGSTYDNRDNLSGRFLHEIERRYAGTRLGKQEIEGAIIDDIDGALWKRKWIDETRVRALPELKRLVVAVDPPASSDATSESPAEAGIVVMGLGTDNQGYVLADYSLVGTPDEWAGEAIAAYSKHKADVIVGETNMGGEMVEAIIRNIAKQSGMQNVPFAAVRATRGKQLRAEPISSLYQRGTIHHVGVFADLEDQQCNWVPGEKSPDRLDALVWAATYLMVTSEPSADDHLEAMKQRLAKIQQQGASI